MTNPLDCPKRTIVAGFLLTLLLIFVVKWIGGI